MIFLVRCLLPITNPPISSALGFLPHILRKILFTGMKPSFRSLMVEVHRSLFRRNHCPSVWVTDRRREDTGVLGTWLESDQC